MNFGMRCHDICPKSDMDTVLNQVENLGVHQIQLALGKSFEGYDFNYGHYSPGFGRTIADKLAKRSIHVPVLGCYINPVHPDEGKRQAEIHKFIEHLKYAKAIGADMVGTETGRYDSEFQVVSYTYTEGCYQLLLQSMKEIITAAEKLGVIVGIEGVHDHTLYCPELMKRFLDDVDSPNVEVILDGVNLISSQNFKNQKEVLQKAFQYYGDKITMVHVKDFIMTEEGPRFAPIGEGLFDFPALMKLLKSEKPYITMLLENSNKDRYFKDIEYLQRVYDEV